jgi:hypothetical protein
MHGLACAARVCICSLVRYPHGSAVFHCKLTPPPHPPHRTRRATVCFSTLCLPFAERQELEEKKQQRAARFAADKAAVSDVPSDDKLKARAARFAEAGTSAAAAAAEPAAEPEEDLAELTDEQRAKRARRIVFEPKK